MIFTAEHRLTHYVAGLRHGVNAAANLNNRKHLTADEMASIDAMAEINRRAIRMVERGHLTTRGQVAAWIKRENEKEQER